MARTRSGNKLDIRHQKVHYGFRATRYTDAAITLIMKERFPIDATEVIETAVRTEFMKLRKKLGLEDLTEDEVRKFSVKKSAAEYKPKK